MRFNSLAAAMVTLLGGWGIVAAVRMDEGIVGNWVSMILWSLASLAAGDLFKNEEKGS